MRDALIVRVDASAANAPVEVRSARGEIFRVRRIAALGIEPPFFRSEYGIVRPQGMLSTKIPKRFGIVCDCLSAPCAHSQICQTRQQKTRFLKIGLTTIFPNVTCPNIRNRIVSARSGVSL